MTKLEEVARAMQAADGVRHAAAWEDESEGNRWDYMQMAIAALKALREPDEAMLLDGEQAYYEDGSAAAIFQAMIESILEADGQEAKP